MCKGIKMICLPIFYIDIWYSIMFCCNTNQRNRKGFAWVAEIHEESPKHINKLEFKHIINLILAYEL